jgi:hypothetical protein
MLDGVENPARPNWVTVNRELSDAEGTVDGVTGPGGAHAVPNYVQTGAEVDGSDSATLEQWREDNAQFMGGEATSTRYQISPVG